MKLKMFNEITTIKTKLLAAFLCMILVMLIIGLTGFIMLRDTQGKLDEALGVRLVNLELIRTSGVDIYQGLVAERALLHYAPGSKEFKENIIEYKKQIESSTENITEYTQQMLGTPEERELLANYESKRQEWEEYTTRFLEQVSSGSGPGLAELSFGRGFAIFSEMEDALDDMGDYYNESAEKLIKSQKRVNQWMAILFALIIVSGITGSVILATWFAEKMVANIKNILHTLEEVKKGNLTVNATVTSQDEVADIAASANNMIGNIKNLVNQAKELTKTVDSSSIYLTAATKQTSEASNEMARTIDDISKGASQQAGDTETAASKIYDLAKNIEKVNWSARDMTEIANTTGNRVQNGLEVVNQLTTKSKEYNKTTTEISEVILNVAQSSHEINAIAATIRDIAKHTKLLSLNAAMEAARAGEYGSGFAVVAEEVRQLAENSAEAAIKVKGLNDRIQSQSQNAVEWVANLKTSLTELDKVVNENEKIFNEISNSLSNLNNKVSEVKDLNQDMDHKKNDVVSIIGSIAAASQETSAATEIVTQLSQKQLNEMAQVITQVHRLRELTDSLSAALNNFKLE